MSELAGITAKDLGIIRKLAWQIKELAQSTLMQDRVMDWIAHNDLHSNRPMVLIELFDIARELACLIKLECEGDEARGIEHGLRWRLLQHTFADDDSVEDGVVNVGWQVSASDYGVKLNMTHSDVTIGYHYDSVGDIGELLGRLKHRTFSVDRKSTLRHKARLEEIFDGILDVRLSGTHYWWTLGLSQTAVSLLGMEDYMLSMYDRPDELHALMSFLRDDALIYAKWLEDEGLLTSNAANTYTGSGSRGFTSCLPQTAGTSTRLKDIWVLLESQETSSCSPEMFDEFVFKYHLDIAPYFGLVYYGCCEPLHDRWKYISALPGLRSVSVSPWCDQEYMGQALKGNYVFSRKPSPSALSGYSFDEQAIKEDLTSTIKAAQGCSLEIIMKDLHTTGGDITRASHWVRFAREAAGTVGK